MDNGKVRQHVLSSMLARQWSEPYRFDTRPMLAFDRCLDVLIINFIVSASRAPRLGRFFLDLLVTFNEAFLR